MNKLMLTLLTSSLLSMTAKADIVSPTAVEASSTFSTYNVINLINESGLSSPVGLTSTHSTSFSQQWMANSGDTTPTLTFDLGTQKSVSSAYIWNYCYSSTRGTKTFDLSYSTDGNSWVNLVNGGSLSMYSSDSSCETFNFSTVTARYMKMDITENYGYSYSTGLAEVKFEAAAIPEPATFGLLGLFGGCIFALRRIFMI
jgi:hypothetical protein